MYHKQSLTDQQGGPLPWRGPRRLVGPARFFALALPVAVLSASMAVATWGTAPDARRGTTLYPHLGHAGGSRGALLAQAVEFDQQFIDMMVPHHEGALEMARIAQQRSTRAEILALATSILQSQEAEIQQMRAWRQAWYGSSETPPLSQMPMLHEAPAGHPMATMNMAEAVEALRTAPEPFDRAFIDAMIAHHQDAIDAARLAEQRATRQEIRDLARAIIADQQREIDQMRQWRAAWFGAADPVQPSHGPGMGH